MEHQSRQFDSKPESSKFNNISIPQMLQKLDGMFDKEEQLIRDMKKLQYEYKQLQDDKELLQTIIMFKSNSENRKRRFGIK